MTDPLSSYRTRQADYSRQTLQFRKRANLVSNLRLLVIAAGVAVGVAAYRAHSIETMVAAGLMTIVLFILLAWYHAGIFERIERCRILAAINGRGVDRCESRWGGFPDAGGEFVDGAHPYTSDLDIFGKNSLFQYLCCSHTFSGRRRLAGLLREGCADAGTIRLRQEAVGELAAMPDWRQQFECYGSIVAAGNDPQGVIDWAEGAARFFRHQWMTIVVQVLPVVTGAVAAVGYFGLKSLLIAYPLLAVQIVLVAVTKRRVHRLFDTFDKYGKALGAFGRMLEHIERREFSGGMLVALRREIAGGGATAGSALRALKRLSGTVAATEIRLSPLPWLLSNIFLLWDLRCAVKLDLWKAMHGGDIRRWLACIAEFEALSSLALSGYEHPSWVFPKIGSGGGVALRMRGAGHPLLDREQVVLNDFDLGPPGGSVGIITGSNMSGKSTFLRTVGCNLVLAFAGAPVCAQTFACCPLRLFTSMRGADDLMSHTSTFYAELLRVKMVVDAVADASPLLFLLDELFRGTNSTDRHDGAVTLLDELSRPSTLGLVSTHDLELCSLARTNALFVNYHFEERYEDGALHFDYLLKNGPSTTRNAMYLMRMVGIGVNKKGE